MLEPLILCLTVAVWDGDSLRCNGQRVRLANIDAPELAGSPRCTPRRARELARSKIPAQCDHAQAIRSRDALRTFLARGPVMVEPVGGDRYGRVLGRVSVNGRDVGQWLVRQGWAREWAN